MSRIYHELKAELYILNIKLRDVANSCNIPYSTLNSQLNGFSRMQDSVYKTITRIITEKKKQLQKAGV